MGLELVYSDILADLGDWMGLQRSGWDVATTDRLTSILKAGQAQFYWPPPLPGEQTSHAWTFLKPEDAIETVVGQGDYDLPSDFGALVGRIYYSAGDNVWVPIKNVGPGMVANLRSRDPSDAAPEFAAVLPQVSDGAASQKWTLALVPGADAVYTLKIRYQVIPSTLDANKPYHLGNAIHSQTLLQSCLAIAERRFRDGATDQQAAFMQALAASVAQDRRNGPQHFGYNGDGRPASKTRRRGYVTYNGVLYDNT